MTETVEPFEKWIDFTPPPRGLQYLDTPFGNRIWRSSAGQIVLEPGQTIAEVEAPKKPRSKKK